MVDKKLKILIVEDEFISRILLKEMLSPFGECYEAADGHEALNLIERSYKSPEDYFDLVCLDIMLPGLSGHEILGRLRKIEKEIGIQGTETVKVMMVSSLGDTKNIMEAMVVGKCQAYITKPVSKGRLEEQLRYLHLIDDVENKEAVNDN